MQKGRNTEKGCKFKAIPKISQYLPRCHPCLANSAECCLCISFARQNGMNLPRKPRVSIGKSLLGNSIPHIFTYHFTSWLPKYVSEPSFNFIIAVRSSSASLIIHLSIIKQIIRKRKRAMKKKSKELTSCQNSSQESLNHGRSQKRRTRRE